MLEKVSIMCFSVQIKISVPRDNCFGGNSAEPCHPANTVIPCDRNFCLHLKPPEWVFTSTLIQTFCIINVCKTSCAL